MSTETITKTDTAPAITATLSIESSKEDEQDAIFSLLGIAQSVPPSTPTNSASESRNSSPTQTEDESAVSRDENPPKYPRVFLRNMGKKVTSHPIVEGQFDDALETMVPNQVKCAVTKSVTIPKTVSPPQDPQRLNQSYEADTGEVNIRTQLAAIASAASGYRSQIPPSTFNQPVVPTPSVYQPVAPKPSALQLDSLLRAHLGLQQRSSQLQAQTITASPPTPAGGFPVQFPRPQTNAATSSNPPIAGIPVATPTVLQPEMTVETLKAHMATVAKTTAEAVAPKTIKKTVAQEMYERTSAATAAAAAQEEQSAPADSSTMENGYVLRKALQVPTMLPPMMPEKDWKKYSNLRTNSSTKLRYEAYIAPPAWHEITSVPKMGITLADSKFERPIKQINENDVLLGRGGMTNTNPGNIKFRELVAKYRMSYCTAPKGDKGALARYLCNYVRYRNGRFLRRDDECKELTPCWYEVGDDKAVQKCGQALREGTADMVRKAVGVSTSPNKKQKTG